MNIAANNAAWLMKLAAVNPGASIATSTTNATASTTAAITVCRVGQSAPTVTAAARRNSGVMPWL